MPILRASQAKLFDRESSYPTKKKTTQFRRKGRKVSEFGRSLCSLRYLLLRPGRLHESRNAGHGFRIRRLEGKLLCEKGNAVPRRFCVQRMRRLIQLEFLRSTHHYEVLFCQLGTSKWFIGRVLQEDGCRRSMRHILARIAP